jgi:hypothetical protein
MNLLQITAGIVDQPGKALSEAAKRPRSWLLPAILLVLSMAFAAWVSAPYSLKLANERSAQMIERITQNLSEEQVAAVRASQRDMTLPLFMLSAVGVGALMAGLGWVARGAIIHFSSMALGGSSSWGGTFAVGVWAMLPFFVRDLLQAAYVLVTKQIVEHPGLSFLVTQGDWLKDSQDLRYAALGNVDPFALWHIVLLGIAIAVATKLSRTTGIIMALILWVIFLGLKLLPVLIGKAVGGNMLGG